MISASRQIGSSTTATQVNTRYVYDAANRLGTDQYDECGPAAADCC
jgi:hypothetical protein